MLALLGKIAYCAIMNGKQRTTLATVFSTPTPTNLEWKALESLFVAVGCKVHEGNGSRVKFQFGEHTWSAHRPHPGKEAIRYQVREAKEFLEKIGVRP